MLAAALIAGAALLFHRPPPRADLTVWTFSQLHQRCYRDSIAGQPALTTVFEKNTGLTTDVQLVNIQAITVRMNALIDNPDSSGQVPDLVEIEVASVGRFFRAPVEQVGFLPLNDWLKSSGLLDQLLKSRLALWSKEGVIFGVPLDVHPTALTYRKDLFDQAGIDLASTKSWDDFQTKCLAFQAYWAAHGYPHRRACALGALVIDPVLNMLLQQRLNLVDPDLTVHLTDPRVAPVVDFYAHCVAGPRAIGGEASPGPNMWVRDLAQGDLCSVFTPDWGVGYIENTASSLSGSLALMPMPKFNANDADSVSWGGTMMAIPRRAADPEKSWALLKMLCFSPEALQARIASIKLLPPLMTAWTDPAWHAPDPLYGGQRVNELFISLARNTPPRYITAFTGTASTELQSVLSYAEADVQNGREDGLLERIEANLRDAQADTEKRIQFGKF